MPEVSGKTPKKPYHISLLDGEKHKLSHGIENPTLQNILANERSIKLIYTNIEQFKRQI